MRVIMDGPGYQPRLLPGPPGAAGTWAALRRAGRCGDGRFHLGLEHALLAMIRDRVNC